MALPSRAKAYADVNSQKAKEYCDYQSYVIHWGQQDDYQLIKILRIWRNSVVFEAMNIKSDEKCVVKVMNVVKRGKIKKEMKILENLKDCPNIIALKSAVKDPLTKMHALIFELVNRTDIKRLYDTLTDFDVRFYLFEMLKALDWCHSMGIMNRNIRLNNMLIDHKNKKLRLIGWDMAEFYHPGRQYSVNVSSTSYKAPELLVNYQMYDYSVDMWSLGCVLASMIFKREPFFQSRDKNSQLQAISKILGTEKLFGYFDKYHIVPEPELADTLLEKHSRKSWGRFVHGENQYLASPEAFDLLNNLLCYDHSERLTAREAMNHSYFIPVLKQEQQQHQKRIPPSRTASARVGKREKIH